jgi:hypothetical protein
MDSLNDGIGIYNTLKTNFARWRESCMDKINSARLDRAKDKNEN